MKAIGPTAAALMLATIWLAAQDAVPEQVKPGETPAALPVRPRNSLPAESTPPIERFIVGFRDIAQASAVTPRGLLLNGKTAGDFHVSRRGREPVNPTGLSAAALMFARISRAAQDAGPDQAQPADTPAALRVAPGKSILAESALPIERFAVGFGDIAHASAVTAPELLLNGRTADDFHVSRRGREPVKATGMSAAALMLAASSRGAEAAVPDAVKPVETPTALSVEVGKSLLVESALPIERVSVGFGDIAEASAVTPRELLLNGKNPGATSLIVWQRGGGKLFFDVKVSPSTFASDSRLEAIDHELKRELPGQNVEASYENGTVFLRGRVKDVVTAERAVAIASTLGHTVNLLYVDVPAAEKQILLRVRFATIDRSTSLNLGFNLASTGAGNTVGGISTQQFSGPQIATGTATSASGQSLPYATLSDALNVFLFRPDLNLMATIQALEQKSLMETLAEPNLLATNGKPASFLAGGEFPFPVYQAGAGGLGSVTIQFREYGVRLNFTPTITPRGTIRLQVIPEVSALDFTSGLVVQGFNVPALTMRRVNTEIELAPGQSFAIGGLLDNSLTETISKIPVLANVPVLGKLFQSKSRTKQNTELIVIVTPELVAPFEAGQAPQMKYPQKMDWPKTIPDQIDPPGARKPSEESIPFEKLIESLKPAVAPTGSNSNSMTSQPQPAAPSSLPH